MKQEKKTVFYFSELPPRQYVRKRNRYTGPVTRPSREGNFPFNTRHNSLGNALRVGRKAMRARAHSGAYGWEQCQQWHRDCAKWAALYSTLKS